MEQQEKSDMRQYLAFRLEGETFCVDVAQVREVLDRTDVTKVPQTPDYMLGVTNLRGSVVPVIDLRQRFGMEAVELTRDSCIVVMELQLEGEMTVIGTLVDAVEEVLDMGQDEIEPPPRLGSRVNVDFIRGVGKRGEEFVMILDIDRIFSSEEVKLFHSNKQETVAQAC